MTPAFFEGPEKKVELAVVDGHPSLRSLGDPVWDAVVRASHAQILSKVSTGSFDSYLLSESSLFVYDSFITMITCGQTRLIDAVALMLEHIPAEAVSALIYERKNEHFPEYQPTSFYDDARRLADWLPGVAHRFGDEHEHAIHVFTTSRPYAPDQGDTTLEVLMHGIGRDCAESFRGLRSPNPGNVAERLGIDRILPGFRIDEHAFQPAGYSLNAVKDETYYTIHVTPERVGSYVSFETNHDFRSDPSGLVARVVELFCPESFDVMSFVPGAHPEAVEIPGYRMRKHVQDSLCGYQVTFQHLYRPPREAQAPVRLDLG